MLEQIISGEQCVVRHGKYKELAPQIECADGTTLSVQASETHYCAPRENQGPYLCVEVGFPSAEPLESWAKYFDGDWENSDRTDSVYGFVPIDLVREFVAMHGGEKD